MNLIEFGLCYDARSSVAALVLWCLVPGGKTGSGGGLLRILVRPEWVFPLGRFVFSQNSVGLLALSRQE